MKTFQFRLSEWISHIPLTVGVRASAGTLRSESHLSGVLLSSTEQIWLLSKIFIYTESEKYPELLVPCLIFLSIIIAVFSTRMYPRGLCPLGIFVGPQPIILLKLKVPKSQLNYSILKISGRVLIAVCSVSRSEKAIGRTRWLL